MWGANKSERKCRKEKQTFFMPLSFLFSLSLFLLFPSLFFLSAILPFAPFLLCDSFWNASERNWNPTERKHLTFGKGEGEEAKNQVLSDRRQENGWKKFWLEKSVPFHLTETYNVYTCWAGYMPVIFHLVFFSHTHSLSHSPSRFFKFCLKASRRWKTRRERRKNNLWCEALLHLSTAFWREFCLYAWFVKTYTRKLCFSVNVCVFVCLIDTAGFWLGKYRKKKREKTKKR